MTDNPDITIEVVCLYMSYTVTALSITVILSALKYSSQYPS